MLNFAFSRPRGLIFLVITALVAVYLLIDSGLITSSYYGALKAPSSITAPNEGSSDTEGSSHGPKILLVSAFFPLSKSKHSMGDYKKWLTRFLGSITTDVYFYAPPEMESLISQARGNLPITINTTFSSPFDIPPLEGLEAEYEVDQMALDRERKIHSPHLYSVWNAKPYFLDEALKNVAGTGKKYNYAFWTDGGSFRETHQYKDWPSSEKVQDMFGEHPETIFIPINWPPNVSMRHWNEGMGPIDNEFSEGKGGQPIHVVNY